MKKLKESINFIKGQLQQISVGGPILFLKKLWSLPLILLAMPVVLFLRILRPWVIVRFGRLLCERIGHFTCNTEVYLCEKDLGMHDARCFDMFYYNAQICNQQLKKMWDRILCVSSIARYADKASRLLPGAKHHIIPDTSDWDIKGLISSSPQHLYFTDEEELLGREGLRNLGIPEDKPFICFHARDVGYLDKAMLRSRDWSYLNFRNSNIDNCILAAREFNSKGYYAIRMGSFAEKALDVKDPMIIDYAIKGRTDFLDIYLCAKCHFFICSTSGIYGAARIFRRPMAIVNYVPLQAIFTSTLNSLFIPKKLWLRQEKRFLGFEEILNSDIGRIFDTQLYERLGIEVIENTPEEIKDLAIELEQRLKGTWHTTEEDEKMQRYFWSLLKPRCSGQAFLIRIGTEFLRQNRGLLTKKDKSLLDDKFILSSTGILK